MPYLLPDDPAVAELGCVLVFYPDAPEYRRALTGQLVEFLDKWNWEGSDADQTAAVDSWRPAIDEYLECLTMGFCDDALAKLTDIETAIYATYCCPSSQPVYDPYPMPNGGGGTITPVGDGDDVPDPGEIPYDIPSSDYPVTTATDPDGGGTVPDQDWLDYACGAGALLLDAYVDMLRFAAWNARLAGGVNGLMDYIVRAFISQLIPGIADDLVIWSLPSVGEVLEQIDNLQADALDTAADEIEANFGAILDAIACEDDAALMLAALETVLSGTITDAFVYGFLSGGLLSFGVSLLWNGLFDAQFSTNCGCSAAATSILFDYAQAPRLKTYWALQNGAAWVGGGYAQFNRNGEKIFLSEAQLESAIGAQIASLDKVDVECYAGVNITDGTIRAEGSQGNSSTEQLIEDGVYRWINDLVLPQPNKQVAVRGGMAADAYQIRVRQVRVHYTLA